MEFNIKDVTNIDRKLYFYDQEHELHKGTKPQAKKEPLRDEHLDHQQPKAHSLQTYHRLGTAHPKNNGETHLEHERFPLSRQRLHH